MRTVILVGAAIGALSGIVFSSSYSFAPKASTSGIDTLSVTKAAKSLPSEQYPAY
jgi:hypothetical protein